MHQLASFGVNMPGCRYNVRVCEAGEPGAERVLRSETGLLVTEKHELRNPFVLPINSAYVVIEALN